MTHRTIYRDAKGVEIKNGDTVQHSLHGWTGRVVALGWHGVTNTGGEVVRRATWARAAGIDGQHFLTELRKVEVTVKQPPLAEPIGFGSGVEYDGVVGGKVRAIRTAAGDFGEGSKAWVSSIGERMSWADLLQRPGLRILRDGL